MNNLKLEMKDHSTKRLFTSISIETQIENLLNEPEFSYTIPSPRCKEINFLKLFKMILIWHCHIDPVGVTENDINDVSYRLREKESEKGKKILNFKRRLNNKSSNLNLVRKIYFKF